MKFLKWLWKKYLPIGQAIGNFMAQLMLTVFYLVIIWPPGVIFRIFADTLKIRKSTINRQKSKFENWDHTKQDITDARKQY